MKLYDDIRELCDAQKGKFMVFVFVKKDGSVRKLLAQPASGKYHVLGEAAADYKQKAVATRKANHPNLLNVWDVDRARFSSVNMDTLRRVSCSDRTYVPSDDGALKEVA